MKKIFLTLIALISIWSVQAQDWIIFDWTNSSLPGNNVSGIFTDNGTDMYIATNQGVAIYDNAGWTTFSLPVTGTLPNFLSSVTPDQNGSIWAGAFQNGVSSYDGSSWTGEHIGNIKDVHVDSINQIWAASSDQGLLFYDGSNWTEFRTNNTPGFNSDVVNCVTDDGKGNIYIGFDPQGNWLGGMARYDGTSWQRWNTQLNNLPDARVNRIAFNPSGKIFLATDGGLCEGSGSTWSAYTTANSGIPSDLVNTVSVDDNGLVWVGTELGLATFDGNTWTVFNTSNSGLLDNRIREIAFDNVGHTWMATGAGVAIYRAGGASVSIEEPVWANDLQFTAGPNPLAAGQELMYQLDLPQAEAVQLSVLNMQGQLVFASQAKMLTTGTHEGQLPLSELATGMYFVRLQVGTVFRTQKILLR